MFQFSPLASLHLWIQWRMTGHHPCRVSPFGHPRISAYVRLPEAFRSLSRPSSPVRAKASTVRPFSLDRICSHAIAGVAPGPPIPFRHTTVLQRLSTLFTPISLHPDFQITRIAGVLAPVRSTCEDFRARRDPKATLALLVAPERR